MFLVIASTEEAVAEVAGICRGSGLPLLVLGNGSNMLVADSGFPGVVLMMAGELAETVIEGEAIAAGAGAMLVSVTSAAIKARLVGLEFAVGIPGTVGGAVMTNAGTSAGSTAGALERVDVMETDGSRKSLEEFADVYRSALVPETDIVLRAVFKGRGAGAGSVEEAYAAARRRRSKTQPGGASAGSVFKNPAGMSAGRLIDEAGLKGACVGAARVSEVHANFIVNDGCASAADILALMAKVSREVEAAHGVRLEPEVKIIGFEEEIPL